MKSKRHQKLLEHYKAVLGEEPAFSLKLKKNVLPNGMRPITTLLSSRRKICHFGNFAP